MNWDKRKNQDNIQKHGFDFSDAASIFNAPMVTRLDHREDHGEERWVGIGTLEGRIVVIVFTGPDETTIRVISLRKALKWERKQYATFLQNRLGQN